MQAERKPTTATIYSFANAKLDADLAKMKLARAKRTTKAKRQAAKVYEVRVAARAAL